MNERIQQLKDKLWTEEYWNNPNTDKLLPAQLNKFAELIVKECVDKITTYDLVPGHSAKWEDIYDIHTRLLQDLGEELKEHFGVTK